MDTLRKVFGILQGKGYVAVSPKGQMPCMFHGATPNDRVSVRQNDLAIVPAMGPFQWIPHQVFINSHNALLKGPR